MLCLPLQVGLHSDVGQTPAVSICFFCGNQVRRSSSHGPPECQRSSVLCLSSSLRYLCCSCEAELWDWIASFLRAQVRLPYFLSVCWAGHLLTLLFLFQNDEPGPPVLRRHSSSDICKQKFGTMPLVPIRGDESNSSLLSANQTLVSQNNFRETFLIHKYFYLSRQIRRSFITH